VKRLPKYKACRVCKALTTEDRCPICGSTDLTYNWEGIIAVIDPLRSKLAQSLGYKKQGIYALRVR